MSWDNFEKYPPRIDPAALDLPCARQPLSGQLHGVLRHVLDQGRIVLGPYLFVHLLVGSEDRVLGFLPLPPHTERCARSPSHEQAFSLHGFKSHFSTVTEFRKQYVSDMPAQLNVKTVGMLARSSARRLQRTQLLVSAAGVESLPGIPIEDVIHAADVLVRLL